MKRKGYLYENIYLYPNLCDAYHKAAKGKHDKKEVIAFKNDFQKNIQKIQSGLIFQKPDIGHYSYFAVRDPKVRLICAASFPERVMHHAIMNVCGPIMDGCAIHDSYACRSEKGQHKAVKRAQLFANNYQWYLKLDIRKFFDSIHHNTMLHLIDKKIKDQRVVLLFQQLLETYQTQPGRGLPIGNLTSQHLANFYLCEFDHWIKEQRRVKAYIRYMDDFILFRKTSTELKTDLHELTEYLETERHLSLKSSIQLNRTSKGIPFLGYRVFPQKVLLSAMSKKRLIKKFRAYEEKCLKGHWTLNELAQHVIPLFEFAHKADSKGLRGYIINQFGASSYRLESRDSGW